MTINILSLHREVSRASFSILFSEELGTLKRDEFIRPSPIISSRSASKCFKQDFSIEAITIRGSHLVRVHLDTEDYTEGEEMVEDEEHTEGEEMAEDEEYTEGEEMTADEDFTEE
ncbi:hypothetical protein GCK72_012583 [Caenorhabditis remanei]|uniref:Uncharacterized protein n=1 Tax=Caenorhabditis remanei TaxID=31234 RepID=A0A6A5GLE2_CAERE|nr:hypothetical protein GCK72_012583 [Caenorhabditis remanei]KAF1756130.1 hypothetical protein GCK72_012583 [Caenorhabditis remanei]